VNAAWGARTDTGRVRKGNEDSYLVEEPLFAVADGMGGHLAGDVASSTAVDVITNRLSDADAANPETLAQMLREANSAIFSRAEDDNSLHGMGTTCTLLMLDDGRAHIAHVGDSRAYLFRDGSLEQLTEDHTLVGRMVREGRLTEQEAERHPQRSIITRALGVDSEVDVDLSTVNLEDGDRVLICSDGLSSMISNDDIAAVLRKEQDPQTAADRLVDLALDAGGEDNVTVVVLAIGDSVASRGADTHAAAGATPPVPARPEPPEAAPAVPTGVVDVVEPAPRAPRESSRAPEVIDAPRRPWRRVALSLFLLLLLVAALYGGARYSLANSWYVGVDEAGAVTIFRGRPETVGGMTLSDPEETTSLRLADLPDYLHDDLREGIKVDSLADAQDTVANLEARVPAGSRGQ
jgi:PPM family protein phosphatase